MTDTIEVLNTLGRRRQPLRTREPGRVGMYVCGATVQSDPHMGHGRYAVVFDTIARYLRYRGYDVTYVRNVTDVEDKIIAAAQEAGVDVATLAEKMAARFDEAFEALNVAKPDVEPRATEHIADMIALIETLIERGHAYAAGGDVYFAVRSWPEYGKLSGRRIDELLSGARVEPGEHKRDPLDFALWKAAKPGEPTWPSPWGPGRPGWHIECSAMSMRYLGTDFDIHGGGEDLIFPHHENEIAQSEAATGERLARYWLHNGMVNLGGEKMSKSTGHLIGLHDAIERYGAMAVRLFYLRAHYRSPQEFSEELLADAEAAVERLRAFRRRAGDALSEASEADHDAVTAFRAAMDDDFNTPEAVAVLFELVRTGNRALDAGDPVGPLVAAFDEIADALGLIVEIDGDLSDLAERLRELAARFGVEAESPAEIVDALLARRAEARRGKDFATADAIRDALTALGITVEDTPDGARWYRD